MKSAIVLGEALIDVFPDRRVVAGAPLHVAIHLADLGWQTRVITRVGDDPDGDEIVATLERFGVETTLVERSDVMPTGITSIEMDGTDHTFTVLPGAWDAIDGPDPMPESDVLYLGTLVLRDPRSRDSVERMVSESNASIVVDLNLRAPDFDEERVRWAIWRADVLKLNEDELPVACDAFAVDHDPAALHEFGPEWVCVTRGPDGAELTHVDGGRWSARAPTIDVVDTVGAGDAFCAVLIDGIATGTDPATVLDAAVRKGAEIASQRGGLPDRR
jgi:fructokinase